MEYFIDSRYDGLVQSFLDSNDIKYYVEDKMYKIAFHVTGIKYEGVKEDEIYIDGLKRVKKIIEGSSIKCALFKTMVNDQPRNDSYTIGLMGSSEMLDKSGRFIYMKKVEDLVSRICTEIKSPFKPIITFTIGI